MTAKLTAALCKFHKDVETIHKESKAQYGSFADLATVLSTVLPALCKNGLAVVQTFEPGETDPILVTTLCHESGESITSHLPMVIGKGRNPLHDWGGSVTYQRRYALLAILCLAAGIEDNDGDMSPASTTVAPPALAKAKPVAAATKEEPAPKLDPEELPITDKDLKSIRDLLAAEPVVKRNKIIKEFNKEFAVPEGELMTAHITLPKHLLFIQERLST
jgi:hypothetical protein